MYLCYGILKQHQMLHAAPLARFPSPLQLCALAVICRTQVTQLEGPATHVVGLNNDLQGQQQQQQQQAGKQATTSQCRLQKACVASQSGQGLLPNS
jgi:hypothetical protein